MRLIDADALIANMLTHCEICPHSDNGHPNRRQGRVKCDDCLWHEAMDEVEDMDEIEANVTATDNAIAVGTIHGGLVIQRAKEITNIKEVGVFHG